MQETVWIPRIGVARKLARDLIKKSGVKAAPVLLSRVISYLKEGRALEIFPVTSFSNRLSGMLVTIESDFLDDRRDEIHVNQNHHWRKRRFTIAHEIGHMLMNTSCSNLEESLHENKPAEIEANQFAAELLMPLAFLKKDFKDGCTVETLAWDYIVSREAMGWKISTSSLLTRV